MSVIILMAVSACAGIDCFVDVALMTLLTACVLVGSKQRKRGFVVVEQLIPPTCIVVTLGTVIAIVSNMHIIASMTGYAPCFRIDVR